MRQSSVWPLITWILVASQVNPLLVFIFTCTLNVATRSEGSSRSEHTFDRLAFAPTVLSDCTIGERLALHNRRYDIAPRLFFHALLISIALRLRISATCLLQLTRVVGGRCAMSHALPSSWSTFWRYRCQVVLSFS